MDEINDRVKELVRAQLKALLETSPSALFKSFRYEEDFLSEPYRSWLQTITPRLKSLPEGLLAHIDAVAAMALDYSIGETLSPCSGFDSSSDLCRQCEKGSFSGVCGGITLFSFFAGLCHDLFRIARADEIYEYTSLYGSPLSAIEQQNHMLAHGAAAAGYLTRVLPSMPVCIKEAVRNHTLPAKDSPVLTQILACADTLEPSRQIPEREAVRVQKLPLSERFRLVLELKKLPRNKGKRP